MSIRSVNNLNYCTTKLHQLIAMNPKNVSSDDSSDEEEILRDFDKEAQLKKSANKIGYKPKKSLTLNWDQIMNFMNNAPDDAYLGTKHLGERRRWRRRRRRRDVKREEMQHKKWKEKEKRRRNRVYKLLETKWPQQQRSGARSHTHTRTHLRDASKPESTSVRQRQSLEGLTARETLLTPWLPRRLSSPLYTSSTYTRACVQACAQYSAAATPLASRIAHDERAMFNLLSDEIFMGVDKTVTYQILERSSSSFDVERKEEHRERHRSRNARVRIAVDTERDERDGKKSNRSSSENERKIKVVGETIEEKNKKQRGSEKKRTRKKERAACVRESSRAEPRGSVCIHGCTRQQPSANDAEILQSALTILYMRSSGAEEQRRCSRRECCSHRAPCTCGRSDSPRSDALIRASVSRLALLRRTSRVSENFSARRRHARGVVRVPGKLRRAASRRGNMGRCVYAAARISACDARDTKEKKTRLESGDVPFKGEK
uniref:Uncharacterized protein n=1 Tax=Trichogramma kaykai TaxID=54128 RepID=A0ABD2WZU3_9HYME